MPDPTQPQDIINDKAYAEASSRAIGRFFAGVFRGMVEAGMGRGDALRVTISYAAAFAGQRGTPDAPDKEK